jgi:K+-sensing histidine kinase KdpD
LIGCTGFVLETALCWSLLRNAIQDVVMVYLLGVVAVALCFGRAAAVATALVSVAAVDFFFTAPYFSFAVNDRRLVLTFVVFLVVAYVIADLTARVRSAQEAAQEREREAQTERLRSALLSSVSHDLRGPLAGILGAATLLEHEGDLDEARGRQCLATITEEAFRLDRLVRHLIDVTSLEAGAIRLRKEWTPLEEIVGVALNRLSRALASRPVDVRIDSDASVVPVDGALLEQVFLNLLENAARYTSPGTPIAISARCVEAGVEVAVTDAGAGVPRGMEERIFEKFERGVRGGTGMGLGLTICRGIVTAHGGRIWYEGTHGGGATFRFLLPRGEPPRLLEECHGQAELATMEPESIG